MMEKESETSRGVASGSRRDISKNAISWASSGHARSGKEDARMAANVVFNKPIERAVMDVFVDEVAHLQNVGDLTTSTATMLVKAARAIETAAVTVTGKSAPALEPVDFAASGVVPAIPLCKGTDQHAKAVKVYLYLHEQPSWPPTLSLEPVLAQLYQHLHPRPSVNGPKMPLDLNHPLLTAWREEKLRLGVDAASVATQVYYVRQILRDACAMLETLPADFTQLPLALVTLDVLEDVWAYHLRLVREGARKFSSVTLGMKYARTFFTWLVQQGIVAENPFDEFDLPMGQAERTPLPLSAHEDQFFTAVANGPDAILHRAVFRLMRGCGLRPGEVATLQLGDISLEGRWVRPFGKGHRHRIVPLPTDTHTALKEYLDQRGPGKPDASLFCTRDGRPFTYDRIRQAFGALKAASGFPWPRGPHVWRHIFATRLAEAGVDEKKIQVLLGHKTLCMVSTYVRPNRTRVRDALETLPTPWKEEE